ncbi:MAG: hypothetical protein FWC24_07235 [Treponema sp.]|nr:hypothetical protein [Treponema sp.]
MVGVLALVAVFLTIFLVIFFCVNLRLVKKEPQDPVTVQEYEELEAITGPVGSPLFWQPFTFITENLELLPEAVIQEAAIPAEAVFERNGIHYVNSAILEGAVTEMKLDSAFVKLIESVVIDERGEVAALTRV